MTDVMARLAAITTVVLAIAGVVALYVTSQPGLQGTEVQAEFEDAYPLLEGMHVREYGAIAGTIAEIEVTDEGTALITMQLHEGTDPPRADAVATIRQEDITGDSYVSLSPGEDPEPLDDEVIPIERTMNAPRFDDLLNSFTRPVRQGLELTLVELGLTLERRGADLNAAALRLRPAIAAADSALGEIGSQNEALRRLIADAEQVSGQAASRSRELGELVEGLAGTAQATAAHAPALDGGLDNLPETLAAARGTLGRLAGLTVKARPLVLALRAIAPQLAQSGRLLGPFIADAEVILGDVEPTLDLTANLLEASTPTLRANPKRVFTAPFDVASAIATLLDTLIGDPDLIRSLFGADTYGGTKPGNFADDVGLGALAVELGTQSGYPAGYDPLRRFVRADAVPSCEMFGLPIRPGCLGEAIAAARGASGPDPEPGGEGGSGPGATAEPGGKPDRSPGPVDDLNQTIDEIVGGLGQSGLPDSGGPGTEATPQDLDDLLDFLFGG